MKINHSFQINSLLKMIFPSLLEELFCGGKNQKVKNDHKSFLRENWFEISDLFSSLLIKDEVLLTVSCPIFPSILIAKNLLTGSLKNWSIDNLETQKKSISMKNSQFFDYLLNAKPK